MGQAAVEPSTTELSAQLTRLQRRLEALELAARHALPCPTCGGSGTVTVVTTPIQDIQRAESAGVRFQPLPGETQITRCPTCDGHGDLVGELPSLEAAS